MSQENLKNALQNFGATEREAEVYMFLVKHGKLRTGQVAKQMKINKGLVYRILHSLEQKRLVEATLESPTRFTAVSLEKVIEAYVKTKQTEIALVEKTKENLLEDWKRISQTEVELPFEKFIIIEGNKKIYQKIAEMIEKTESELSAVSRISDLVRAEQFGVFDSVYRHPRKTEIKFRFLTEIDQDNLRAFRLLRAELKPVLNIKIKNPDLGLSLFPRMVIRDNEEILFFISPRKEDVSRKQDACIHTNSRSLVQAFNSVFEDLWLNSTDMEQRIIEIETGIPTLKTVIISDAKKAKEKYIEILNTAEKELILMTSTSNLIQISRILPIKLLKKRNVIVKIMAPITNENLGVSEHLLKFFQVRHVASGRLEHTVIDGKHLFQLKESIGKHEEFAGASSFKNTYYTNDLMYIKKVKRILGNLWSNSFDISKTKIYPSIKSPRGNMFSKYEKEHGKIPQKYLEAGKKHLGVMSGLYGEIIINPPAYLKMPDLRITAVKADKGSSLGEADILRVDLWLKTSKGETWIPKTLVTDGNPKVVALSKAQWARTPTEKNIISVKPDELEIWVKGNTLFAGWTIPISLGNAKYKLDPACILFEKYGDEGHRTYSLALPSGYLMGCEIDGFSAFTTFIGPSWRYSGPGIHGSVGKIIVVDAKSEAS